MYAETVAEGLWETIVLHNFMPGIFAIYKLHWLNYFK